MSHYIARFVGGFVAVLVADVALATAASATSCRSVSACVFGLNFSAGPGVEGSSATGFGLLGVSTSNYGVEGTSKTNDGVVGRAAVEPVSPGTGKAGVSGYDDSTNKKPYNSGVYGVSRYAMGVQGRSTYGPGMLSLSYHGNAVMASAGNPQFSGFTNTGVVAQSVAGAGMIGIGATTGVTGFAAVCNTPDADVSCPSPFPAQLPSGGALTAGTDEGGLGLNIVTDTDPNLPFLEHTGTGAAIDAGGIGMSIQADRAGAGAPALIVQGASEVRDPVPGTFQGEIINALNGLSITSSQVGVAASGSPSIVAQSQDAVPDEAVVFQGQTSNGTVTSSLDGAGDLTLAGKVVQNGSALSRIANSDGTYSTAYDARSTVPTVEDMGEGSLVSGKAYVTLDPALHRAIDVARGYLVFLTPQGPTSGLYVSGKTAAGFAVREIGTARDSLAFDYRIVAHPYAERGARLASASIAIASATHHAHLFYRRLKPLRFVHGRLDKSSFPLPSM